MSDPYQQFTPPRPPAQKPPAPGNYPPPGYPPSGYPPSGYPPPGYPPPSPYGETYRAQAPYSGEGRPAAAPSNGLSIASLIVGIIAVAVMPLPFVLMRKFGYGYGPLALGPILVGVVTLGLGIAAFSRVRAGTASNRGLAITGLVLGCVTALGGILLLGLAMMAVF